MLISLIVPFYNLEVYARETLRSIVAARQALGPQRSETEVICVDDGSADGTGRILDEMSDAAGFRVIHQRNGGEGSARNAGIEAAVGEYLLFLDGDDVLLDNALVTAVDLLRGNPGVDIVAMRLETFADGGSTPDPVAAGEERRYDLRQEIPSEVICRQGVTPTLFRRSALGDLRFSELPLGADREYVMLALSKAGSIVCSNAVVEGYRLRKGSMARAEWAPAKIRSLNDHACRGLAALASSGRRVGLRGSGYLASLVVSEVPARMARLGADCGLDGLWRHWIESVAALPVRLLPAPVGFVRRLILSARWSRGLSVGVARLCRAMGLA